jgi:hypothetical protein
MKNIPMTESAWINSNIPFECQPIEFFMEMERIPDMYRPMESRKSAAPMAIFPHGINCRNKSKLAGVSKMPCARRDRNPVVIRRALIDNNEGMLFMRIAQKTRLLRNITPRPGIPVWVTYNLESIYLI